MATADTNSALRRTGYARPAGRVRIEELTSWQELAELRGAWEELLTADPKASIFATPEWLGSWWQAYGDDRQFLALTFHDPDGTLVGLAPLTVGRTSLLGVKVVCLQLLGDGSGDSDQLDVITRPEATEACATGFLEWCKDQTRFDVYSLNTLPEDSAFASALIEKLRRARWPTYVTRTPGNCILLPSTWDEYVAQLDPQFRPLLTRYAKRLETRHQVRILRCEDKREVQPCLEQLFALHQKRWEKVDKPGAFSDPRRRAFYAQLSSELLRRGWLDFWLLETDGAIVAAQFCFHYRDSVSLLQEGFDPEYAAEKVGYALRAAMLQALIRAGYRKYDFLGGDDPHKRRFAALPTSYINLNFARPRSWGQCYIKYQQMLNSTRKRLKENLPPGVVTWIRTVRSGGKHAG